MSHTGREISHRPLLDRRITGLNAGAAAAKAGFFKALWLGLLAFNKGRSIRAVGSKLLHADGGPTSTRFAGMGDAVPLIGPIDERDVLGMAASGGRNRCLVPGLEPTVPEVWGLVAARGGGSR